MLPSTITYNEHTIKIIGTFTDIWICANDICNILQYKPSSYTTAISSHVDECDKKSLSELAVSYHVNEYNKTKGRAYYINESGLMDLVCSCRLNSAKDFKRYVMKEIRDMRNKSAVDDFKKNLPQLTEFTNEEMVIKLEAERQLRIAAEAKAEEERLLKEEERMLKEEEMKLKQFEEEYSRVAMVRAMEKDRKIYKMEYRLGGDRPLAQSRKSKLSNLESSRRKALGARLDVAKVKRDNARYDLLMMKSKLEEIKTDQLVALQSDYTNCKRDVASISQQLESANDKQVSANIISKLNTDLEYVKTRLVQKEAWLGKCNDKINNLTVKIADREIEFKQLEEAAAKALKERYCRDTDEIFGPVKKGDVSDSDPEESESEAEDIEAEDIDCEEGSAAEEDSNAESEAEAEVEAEDDDWSGVFC